MKLIVAYIRPERLPLVQHHLRAAHVGQVSVVPNALGSGHEKGYPEEYRGVATAAHLRPKARLEVAVENDLADEAVSAILAGAQTGVVGDGRIFVIDLAECIRIRTGEREGAVVA